MNEVKLSTQVSKNGKSRLAVQMDMQALGLDWKATDTIRVVTYKKEGRIVLKRVGKKISKTVCHSLTATGSGKARLGLYVNNKGKRFGGDFAPVKGVSAAVRFCNGKKNELEVHLPKELYQAKKAA